MKTTDEILNEIGYHGFVKAMFNRTGDLSKDFSHAVLGVVTEFDELTRAVEALDAPNVLEELGDIAFFQEALKQVLNDMDPIDHRSVRTYYNQGRDRVMSQPTDGAAMVTEWLDLAKRWVGYGKAPTMPTSQLLAEMQVLIDMFITTLRRVYAEKASAAPELGLTEGILKLFDRAHVQRSNVEKLLVRYNGLAFDAERAVNRDLAAERATLESQ